MIKPRFKGKNKCCHSICTLGMLKYKTAHCNGIRTRVMGVKDEHGDHLTTSMAPIRLTLNGLFLND